jgi:hypothetical protein
VARWGERLEGDGFQVGDFVVRELLENQGPYGPVLRSKPLKNTRSDNLLVHPAGSCFSDHGLFSGWCDAKQKLGIGGHSPGMFTHGEVIGKP